MFSVVIPLYNKSQSISATLNSVLAQDFEDFEIVLVNDGSTDGSLEVVKQIQDARIRIIDQKNGGVSSARNRGIREAKYEWVAFLDGDDLWTANHLEEYNHAINIFKDVNWLFSGYTAKSTAKIYPFIYNKNGKLKNIFDDLQNNIKIHTSTVCVRKTLFSENPELFFREGISNSEDREVWYKLCFLDKSPYYINKSLSIYYVDVPDSLTKSSTGNQFLNLEENLYASTLYDKVDVEDKIKITNYISLFNRNALKWKYMNGESLDTYYKNYFTRKDLILLKIGKGSPLIVRKIILKL